MNPWSRAGGGRAYSAGWPTSLGAGLAVFDLVMLLSLAMYARPMWKWWFWGVVLVLMLLMPLVVYAYLPTERKLREAGLPLP